jgi:DNA-binding CsgD family transcriptional regulator
VTEGYDKATSLLQEAVSSFRSSALSEDDALRWLSLVCWVAHMIGEDEAWDELSNTWLRVAHDSGGLSAVPLAVNERAKVEFAFCGAETAAAVAEAGVSVETRATMLNGAGRWREALTVAQFAGEPDPVAFASAWACSELVEAATRNGSVEAAVQPLERLAERARASRSEWALGIEARSRALVCAGAEAEALYLRAIDHLERTRVKLELARAHLLYGEWLRREGRRIDAREHLRAAYDDLSSMGAESFAARAHRELLATGETARRRIESTRGDLTPQETEIARLAAQGHTNPQIGARLFISPRTVQYHLRKVFQKLDVHSRNDLRTALPLEAQTVVAVAA